MFMEFLLISTHLFCEVSDSRSCRGRLSQEHRGTKVPVTFFMIVWLLCLLRMNLAPHGALTIFMVLQQERNVLLLQHHKNEIGGVSAPRVRLLDGLYLEHVLQAVGLVDGDQVVQELIDIAI
ncbi:hypothetical protein KDW_11320 [Dictyobacter vulcani]|uniref:Uncharacterized protein n=1 Tax=Dictyobacter vulcani TaxID=2607529 RepID=A0A5J4KKP0_9CHLR|nr:hypothetical protein KDW_11320 [Dictyobacter vulcani]